MFPSPLFFLAESRGIMWYVEQCDPYARAVVAILFVLSIVSISTIVQKIVDLRRMRKQNLIFESINLRNRRFIELEANSETRKTQQVSAYETVFDSALRALKNHRGIIEDESDIRVCVSHIENGIQRAIGRVVANYEKGMIRLSTFVSGGPFLGLFGTVLGVMVTFGALTEKATISQLAPGVAGALLATTFGLLLAIPASFAYNWVLGYTRKMATELDNFASAVADQMETELLEDLRKKRKADAVARGDPAAKISSPTAFVSEPPAPRNFVPAAPSVPATSSVPGNPFLREEKNPFLREEDSPHPAPAPSSAPSVSADSPSPAPQNSAPAPTAEPAVPVAPSNLASEDLSSATIPRSRPSWEE